VSTEAVLTNLEKMINAAAFVIDVAGARPSLLSGSGEGGAAGVF
jgi:hypothetical protein